MTVLDDLRFALRTLRKNPGFTLAAVLALALGIGANSAMFSVIDGILLRPLPFPQSERLVNVWETNAVRNIPRFPVAAANYYDWRKQNQVFAALGAVFAGGFYGGLFGPFALDVSDDDAVGVFAGKDTNYGFLEMTFAFAY